MKRRTENSKEPNNSIVLESTFQYPDEIWKTIFKCLLPGCSNNKNSSKWVWEYASESNLYELKLCLWQKQLYFLSLVSLSWAKLVTELVQELFSSKRAYSDWILSHFLHCTELDMARERKHYDISDYAILKMTNLVKLTIDRDSIISNEALCQLTQLRELNVFSSEINDGGIEKLYHLTSLVPSPNMCGLGFKNLTNLQSLNLRHNYVIGDDCVSSLTGLRKLSLFFNNRISSRAISKLTNLTDLNVGENHTVCDEGIMPLTNLTALNLSCVVYHSFITVESLKNKSKLLSLNLEYNDQVTNELLRNFVHLTSLNLRNNSTINDDTLKQLTNLSALWLQENPEISDISVKCLTNLERLSMRYTKITEKSLKELRSLRILELLDFSELNNDSISHLVSLREITLVNCPNIDSRGLISMHNLTSLSFSDSDKSKYSIENLIRDLSHLPSLALIKDLGLSDQW